MSSIVIIGAGVVGASVACHLVERGARGVRLLERAAAQGAGSTGQATGGVRAQFETAINIEMSRYSLDYLQNCGFDCGYEPRGYLFFATGEPEFEYLRRNVEFQKSLGVRDVAVVDRAEIARLCPILETGDIVGGSFGAHDGFVNPLAIMRGFTERALAGGARLDLETAARAIETRGGRVTAVVTDGGRVECEAVVLATGAWARELAATAGVELPVAPQKRQIVWARAAAPLPAGLPMTIDIGSGFHFRPARDFRDPSANADGCEVLFAYPDPDAPESFATDFDEAFIPKVYERARRRAPQLAETTVVREKCRAGLYENTPDHHAILGGCEVGGLYFANGFSGHGVMHSPATGRALAEIVLDGRASFLDVSCLALERFRTGALLRVTAFI